ncbi:MAG TPA: hypothetical protein VFF10_09830 [Trueperaceae bacterium]|nr:hypothetical protein [Trueperaceae bacterium]
MFLDERKTETGGQRVLTPGGDVEPREGTPVVHEGRCYLPIFYVSRYHGTRQAAWLVVGPDKMPSREVVGQHFDVVTMNIVDSVPGTVENTWAPAPYSAPVTIPATSWMVP